LLHVYPNALYIYDVPNQKPSAADALFEIIEQQQGYFTAKQAAEAGYRLGSQAHHVKAGNWLRVERGIYRLARFPRSMEEQYVIYSLWSRNRVGAPVGVYSHETALSIHELSDANPARLQMTVPPGFRRAASTPKVLMLHRACLDRSEIEHRQGFAVTKAIRAVADVAALGKQEFAAQALREGTKRGVITRQQLLDLRRKGGHPEWFVRLLERYGA
jgi:predicted transcriptional regulator of viral defense system